MKSEKRSVYSGSFLLEKEVEPFVEIKMYEFDEKNLLPTN